MSATLIGGRWYVGASAIPGADRQILAIAGDQVTYCRRGSLSAAPLRTPRAAFERWAGLRP